MVTVTQREFIEVGSTWSAEGLLMARAWFSCPSPMVGPRDERDSMNVDSASEVKAETDGGSVGAAAQRERERERR